MYRVLNLILQYIWSCILIKAAKIFFRFLPQNLTFLYSGIFWEMHILISEQNDGHIHVVNISNGNSIFHVRFCLFDFILYVHSTIFQLCGTVLPGFNQY